MIRLSEIIGVTYPIPKQYMDRFFKEGKDVFVKPATTYKELKPGMKFVFYQSREDTGYIGEAKIKRVTITRNPLDLYETYGDRIFLKKEELKEYKKSQESWSKDNKRRRDWMAIELEDIKSYKNPIKPKRFVPVGGQYLKK